MGELVNKYYFVNCRGTEQARKDGKMSYEDRTDVLIAVLITACTGKR